ncbi:hypothetical protein OIDMADRAFT_47618 [Oidiodendron maius Zn]|uniref:Uncharacterized protein n=1 Tax=Oidiodendron maius (strain Zn) TaxID=913774 RepID=A0A0C3HXX7_OIDMZ|nr:hypothetical protein OIDMADRAFT_47618 [Oidiodendron maius Zn]
MAEGEGREDELFLKLVDVEHTAFLGRNAHLKLKKFISASLLWMINAALAITILGLLWDRNYRRPIHHYRDQGIYLPTQDVIEYHTMVFSSDFGKKKTQYQGPPTDEVDALRSELYDAVGINKTDKMSVMQFPKPYGAYSWRRRSLYYWAGCFPPDTLFKQSTKTYLA